MKKTSPRAISVRTQCGCELIEPKADRADIDGQPSEKELRRERLAALLRYDRMRQAARLQAADRLPPAQMIREAIPRMGPRTGSHPMASRTVREEEKPVAHFSPPFRPFSDLEAGRLADAATLACFLAGVAALIWVIWEWLR